MPLPTALGAAALAFVLVGYSAQSRAAPPLDAGIAGTASFDFTALTAQVTGTFTSYAASPEPPQITGGDLDQYSFQATASGLLGLGAIYRRRA